jgi:hypothetical protein
MSEANDQPSSDLKGLKGKFSFPAAANLHYLNK